MLRFVTAADSHVVDSIMLFVDIVDLIGGKDIGATWIKCNQN